MSNEESLSGKKVVIGLTGRTDSAVAALLLKKQGMTVIGISLVQAQNEMFKEEKFTPICHITELEKVKELCNKLNITFYASDSQARFRCDVIDPLVSARLVGESNNSCFDCNKMRIKVLYEKMKKLKADYIATGHYCKVQKNLNSSQYFIHTNNDAESDQSHLLSGIEAKYLKHLILPLGELKRSEVEKIAHKFALPVVVPEQKKNFCFEEVDSYYDFAKKQVPKSLIKEGQFQSIYTELYHGDHEGILKYKISQKDLPLKGLNQSDPNYEIIEYDFVSGLIKLGTAEELTHEGFQIVYLKLGLGLDRTRPLACYIKNKNQEILAEANLYFKTNDTALIDCKEPIYPLVRNQSFIIYDKNTRNAKIIGVGKVGITGKFKLIDRASEFRSSEGNEEIQKTPKVFKF